MDDDPAVVGEPVVVAGPSSLASTGLVLGAVVVAVLALQADTAGRLLGGIGAVLLLVLGLRDLALAPVLRADRDGLEIVTGIRRRRLPWEAVTGLRLVRERRTPLLEVDADETVVLLSRWRLGRPPDAVLTELLALRPRP